MEEILIVHTNEDFADIEIKAAKGSVLYSSPWLVFDPRRSISEPFKLANNVGVVYLNPANIVGVSHRYSE